VFVARSRDGGRTFDRPTEVTATSLHQFGEMPVVLADGTVVASFVEDAWSRPFLANRRGLVIRSTDGATTFSPAALVNDTCGPPPPFQLSALAVDRSKGPSTIDCILPVVRAEAARSSSHTQWINSVRGAALE